jgi:hypothetical protein
MVEGRVGYTSNDGMMVNDELERMWNEAVVAYFEVILHKPMKCLCLSVCLQAEIRTRNLQNTNYSTAGILETGSTNWKTKNKKHVLTDLNNNLEPVLTKF